jgi:RNA-directed DNA polymerase
MNLTTLTSVQKLQTALHAKAKESPDFRFYAPYDKVYRKDVLVCAYKRCKANGGAEGVDNQTFEDIEQHDMERWLDELAQELKSQTYQPQPVRRVAMPRCGCVCGCEPNISSEDVQTEDFRIHISMEH